MVKNTVLSANKEDGGEKKGRESPGKSGGFGRIRERKGDNLEKKG